MTEPPIARFSICLLQDATERLLFLKRAAGASLGADTWGFPAGHIETNETPQQCAIREMDEEIGPDHELQKLNVLGPMRDTFYGGRFEIHLFHYQWIAGAIILNDEHTEFCWVNAAEFTDFETMLGTEEDIVLLNIWPHAKFDPARLPPTLQRD